MCCIKHVSWASQNIDTIVSLQSLHILKHKILYFLLCSHLKEPALPIWVVCSESHFTLLYRLLSDNRDASGSASLGSDLTLMYYDGLANQEQPIKLTVSKALQPDGTAKHDQTDVVQHKGSADNGLVPPLEHVLHTKWPEATVHWSGCEPIL